MRDVKEQRTNISLFQLSFSYHCSCLMDQEWDSWSISDEQNFPNNPAPDITSLTCILQSTAQ